LWVFAISLWPSFAFCVSTVSSCVTWLADEQDLPSTAWHQVRRMVVRSAHRPFVTLAVALVLGGFVFVQVRRPKMYEAEVGLLITEGAFAADGRPRPKGELRTFIDEVVFAAPRLEALVRKHDLVDKLGGSSQTATVARVRRLVEVNTWHDYFESLRQPTGPPRSVRVTISFSAPDPALALAVAKALGELVAETQTARESEAAAARVEGLRVVAEGAAARARDRHEELDQARRSSMESTAISRSRVDQLVRAAGAADDASKTAAANLFEAQLRARAVHQVGGLVQIVKPGLPFFQTASRGRRLANQVALASLLGFFFAVILVGAFDPTVRDDGDLRRAGFRPLGRVPVGGHHSSHAGV
jgi:hypothetical protein